MKVTRRRTKRKRGNHAAYVAYGNEADNHAIELLEEFATSVRFDIGNSYWRLNFSLPDMMVICARMKKDGIEFVEDPTPMAINENYQIAFIKDPDGYEVELTYVP